MWIEANELEIALAIYRSFMLQSRENRVLFWKMIRDPAAPGGGSEVWIFVNGALRTLHIGTGTIIIYDEERSELLGFIARDVNIELLVTALIPLLTDSEKWQATSKAVFYREVTNSTSHDDNSTLIAH